MTIEPTLYQRRRALSAEELDGIPWLVADLHARNFVRCADGELRVIDIVTAPWPEAMSPRDPLMAEWLERVRRDPAAGALRSAPDDEL